jgi:S-layer homology domain
MNLSITLSGRRLALIAALVATAIAVPVTVFATVGFNDVPPSNTFYNDINAIAAKGVTTGCGGGNYCPKDYVTREQMAAFMNRLGALSPSKTPVVNADKLDGKDSTQFVQGRVGGIAYVWANLPTTASYTPDTGYSFNSAGGAVSITRTGTGAYTVTFSGLSLVHGNVQVSKYNVGAGECHPYFWNVSSVYVRCYDASGAAVDAQFSLLFID